MSKHTGWCVSREFIKNAESTFTASKLRTAVYASTEEVTVNSNYCLVYIIRRVHGDKYFIVTLSQSRFMCTSKKLLSDYHTSSQSPSTNDLRYASICG